MTEPGDVQAAAVAVAHRIVLVEDSPDLLSTLSECLRLLGYEVEGFRTYEGALTYMQDGLNQFHTLVCDMNLDGRSGTDLVHLARKERDINVILMSGSSAEIRHHGHVADISLQKPVKLATLSEALERLHAHPRPAIPNDNSTPD